MAWGVHRTDRRETLPPDWPARRAMTFERDGYRCVHVREDTGTRCAETTNLECDHINDRGDHSLENLRTLCRYHHAKRSGGQGGSAAAVRQRKKFRRPEETRKVSPGPSLPPWMRRCDGRQDTEAI